MMLEAKNILKKLDLKITPQRLYVLAYFLKHHPHPTAEEVFREITKTLPTISKTTIYNVLEDFSKAHLLKKLTSPDGKVRYDLDLKPHHHLIDVENHIIMDYEDEELNNWLKNYFEQKNFPNLDILSIQVEVILKRKTHV